jgi:hypothetical protein
MSAETGFLEQFGSYLIAGFLGLTGWVMNTFTNRHLAAMDELTREVKEIGRDMSSMKTEMVAMRREVNEQGGRIQRLEEFHMDDGK